MSWRQSSIHMERALLERCPNTILRRRASEGLKVQPRVTDLSLPNRRLRPISTAPAAAPMPATTAAEPCYTSLAEMIPTEHASVVESASSPRTPMRNRLVEKAARAYLLPSDSFDKSRLNNSPHSQAAPHHAWTHSFSRFLPRLSMLTMALNPFHAFSSAFQVVRFYVTGARALQPQLVSRSVSRSFSMPLQRSSFNHDLRIR